MSFDDPHVLLMRGAFRELHPPHRDSLLASSFSSARIFDLM